IRRVADDVLRTPSSFYCRARVPAPDLVLPDLEARPHDRSDFAGGIERRTLKVGFAALAARWRRLVLTGCHSALLGSSALGRVSQINGPPNSLTLDPTPHATGAGGRSRHTPTRACTGSKPPSCRGLPSLRAGPPSRSLS